MGIVRLEDEIEQQGFELVSGFLDEVERAEILSEVGAVSGAGRRDALSLPAVTRLAGSSDLLGPVRTHRGGRFRSLEHEGGCFACSAANRGARKNADGAAAPG